MTPARSVPTASEKHAVADRVERLMPELKADLIRLARIPSVTFPEFPTRPVLDPYDLVAELLRDARVDSADTLSLPGTAPIVIGEMPAPEVAGSSPLAGPASSIASEVRRLPGPATSACSLRAPGGVRWDQLPAGELRGRELLVQRGSGRRRDHQV